MKITKDSVIGEIVSPNYRTAKVFEKYGIYFCCGGKQSVQDACSKNFISNNVTSNIVQELNEVLSKTMHEEGNTPYVYWPLDDLVNHIETEHHTYVEEKIPVLALYRDKLAKVHGKLLPELIEINTIFQEASG